MGAAVWLLFIPNHYAMLPAKLRKGQLPTKVCVTCGRPFEYRKKWRANWDDVKYCGEKCQRNRPAAGAATAAT